MAWKDYIIYDLRKDDLWLFFFPFFLRHGITGHLQQRRKYHLEAADGWRSNTQKAINLPTELKLALDLMAGIWAGREFHNWAVHV